MGNSPAAEVRKIYFEDTKGWSLYSTGLLETDKKYLIDACGVGKFPVKGGSCGNFTLQNNGHQGPVTISDEDDNILWTWCEKYGQRITFLNESSSWTTHVIMTAGGKESFPGVIPINVRYPEDLHYLCGKRGFTISGDRCHLVYAGSGKVIVTNNMAQVEQQMDGVDGGIGEIVVDGSVTKNVFQQKMCRGRLEIKGGVVGNIVQEGDGWIQVGGWVNGDIVQKGNGGIFVNGGHLGKIKKSGNGRINVDIPAV